MRVVIALCLAYSPLVLAQDIAAQANQGAKLEADLKAAQAAAVHKGDEKMTCDQIQAELTKVMQSPGFQSVAATQAAGLATIANAAGVSNTAGAANSQTAASAAQAAAAAATAADSVATAADAGTAATAAKTAGALFKSLGSLAQAANGAFGASPGATATTPAASTAASSAAVAQATGVAQSTIGMAQAAASSPEFMRGAQLVQLASAKGCTLTGAAFPLPAGVAPPSAAAAPPR